MEEVVYPPRCQPLNIFSLDGILIEGLQKILNYFTDFSHQCDNIYKYKILWSHMNEIAKLHNSQRIALLATSASVEMCRNFVSVPYDLQRYINPDNFRALYELVAKFLTSIKEDNFVLRYNLLRRFAEDELFRLDHITPCLDRRCANQMFLTMFKPLTNICSEYDATEGVHQLGVIGIGQLIDSAGHYVDLCIVLREFFGLLLTGNAPIRYMIKQCARSLKVTHFQMLCRIVLQRVTQATKSDVFHGNELIVAEKAIMIAPTVQVFETIIYVIQKACLNYCHLDHRQIIRLMCALIVRYTGETKSSWQSLDLEFKRVIQTMISKFLKAMMRKTPKPYTAILQKYGAQLLQNAPDSNTKFQYFKMFQYYTKISTGEAREYLGKIFEDGLSNLNIKPNAK